MFQNKSTIMFKRFWNHCENGFIQAFRIFELENGYGCFIPRNSGGDYYDVAYGDEGDYYDIVVF